jgi:hypothetical protein
MGAQPGHRRGTIGKSPDLNGAGVAFGPIRSNVAGRPNDACPCKATGDGAKTTRVDPLGQVEGFAYIIGRCVWAFEQPSQQHPSARRDDRFAAGFQRGHGVLLSLLAFGCASAWVAIVIASHGRALPSIRGQPAAIHSRICDRL